jgi:hypothetical protein
MEFSFILASRKDAISKGEATNDMVGYPESSRPILMGIVGPPHNETASAPATAIKSAHDTEKLNP